MHGIHSGDGSFHGYRFEQVLYHLDFVGGGRYLGLGDHGCFLMEKCRQEVHSVTVVGTGSLQAFAIHSDDGACSNNRLHPAGDCHVHCLSIDRPEEASDGWFTGCLIERCSLLFSASQSFEHVLGTCFTPLCDGIKATRSAREGTDGDGEDSQPVVAYSSGHAALRDGQKGLLEAIGIIFRELHGGEPRSEWRLKAWVGKLPGSVFLKRSDKDRFDPAVMDVDVMMFGKSFGVTQKGPTGCPITRSSIQLGVDKRFGKPDRMPVCMVPVIGKSSEIESENA